MGKIIDKLTLPTGVDSRNNFDLSCFHATTSTFYTPRVTYFHEFVPGEVWKMDARCICKTLPMQRPVIADVKIHNRFFFVPYYSIFNHWNEFLAETPMSTSEGIKQPKVPWVWEATVTDLFTSDRAFSKDVGDAAQDYDFKLDGYTHRYKFTPLGRTCWSILSGLGYALNFQFTDSVTPGQNGHKLSMLPLLAYLKIYLDWYNNSAFDSKIDLNMYFDLLYTTGEYNRNDLRAILVAVSQIYLEKDYFTSATLYPVGSNNPTMQLEHKLPDITQNARPITVQSLPENSSTHGTPYAVQSVSLDYAAFSKYSLDSLNALTDYVKRHQLAGIQPFNRVLAEYGVTLKDEELRRSTFIGDCVEDLHVDDVVNQTATATDTSIALGDRGGLGASGNSKKLDFRNDNFGCIICISTIVPRTSYPDGIRRHCLRTERFDFFTPSVEHLGVEPVLSSELYNRFDGSQSVGRLTPEKIFGYLPRYAAYKTALDSISGDFAIHSRRDMLDSWILQRRFNFSMRGSTEIDTISEDFTTADPSKVNNIFVDNETDNFIIFNMYHVNASLPMHKLFDDYQWSNEDDNPKHVTLPNQGVQLT